MKTWTVAFLAFSYLTTVSAGTEIDPLISKIDERINAPATEAKVSEVKSVKVDVPLDLAFQRESALWTSITAAYDHLRSYDLQARHRFLYFASKVNAKPHAERVQELKKWIANEAHLVQSLGMPSYFYTEWKKKTAAINEAISGLEAPYPSIEVKPEIVQVVSEDKAFLNEIKDEIKTMASAPQSPVEAPAPDYSLTIAGFDLYSIPGFRGLQYVIYAGAVFVAFLLGFTLRRSKDEDLRKLEAEKRSATPPPVPKEVEVVHEVVAAAPIIAPSTNTFFFDQGVSLEEECKKIIEQNSHLLQLAQLNVVPAARSPFKTSVDAPAEKVGESLSWLLKGTLAMANSGIGKATHLEWQCREQHGRVSLEFVLHGLECDLKALYLNTLVEGDGSAPAHFGRSEMALAEHLASVGFKSGNKKTTVSLGLDTLSSTLSH